jgi:hypothetical protein
MQLNPSNNFQVPQAVRERKQRVRRHGSPIMKRAIVLALGTVVALLWTLAIPAVQTGAAVPESGVLAFAQIEGFWVAAGGPSSQAALAATIAITGAESSYLPGIIQQGQPYATTGWGLWQITPGNSESQFGQDYQLLDPWNNAEAAVAKYRDAGSTFRPWSTYNDGAYLKYLPSNPPAPAAVTDPGQFIPIGSAPAGTHNTSQPGTTFGPAIPGTTSSDAPTPAAPSATPTTAAPISATVTTTPRSWAAVVEGGDGAAWYHTTSSSWNSLGGRVLTTPAVANYANNPYGGPVPLFVTIGTDHQVWVTSIGSAPTWYPVGGYCLSSPTAAILNSASGGMDDLTIACEGGDRAMWVEHVLVAPVGPAHNPIPVRILQGYTSYGGILAAGPAMADVNGPVFFAEGPSHQVFYTTQPNAWVPTPFSCTGHLAGGISFASPAIVLGCQGTDGQMWTVTTSSANALTGLTSHPQGGALLGGPGLASEFNNPPLMFAEGTDHQAWVKVAGATSWSSLGGFVLGDGINATTL